MKRLVCKFGGTSVATARQLAKVRAILDDEPTRRVVVVSAPGRRTPEDVKVTDLLYACHRKAADGVSFDAELDAIEARFEELRRELELSLDLGPSLKELRAKLRKGCSADYAASRGEQFNGEVVAAYLGADLIDPTRCISLRADGQVEAQTYTAIAAQMADPERRYVVPGFFGAGPDGEVKTFSRGGSDITGALVARAIGASAYENWTDVSGILMADPRVVDDPRPMAEVTYRELRELAYMGASVVHDEAIAPVREAGIPLFIRNTNRPHDPGTAITPRLSEAVESTTEIAGIAGKKSFTMICVEKSLMNNEVGFAHRLLGIFERQGVSIEHCPSSIDTMNVICETRRVEGLVDELIGDIERQLEP
ncbi:MAG: aspartate kinase, partial [Myxococcota bacterium]